MEESYDQKLKTYKSTSKTLQATTVNKNAERRVCKRVKIILPSISESCEEMAAIKMCAKDEKEFASSNTEKQGTPSLKERTPPENRKQRTDSKGLISQKYKSANPTLKIIDGTSKRQIYESPKAVRMIDKDEKKVMISTLKKPMPKRKLFPLVKEDEEVFAPPSTKKTGTLKRQIHRTPESSRKLLAIHKEDYVQGVSPSPSTKKTPSKREVKASKNKTPIKENKEVNGQKLENGEFTRATFPLNECSAEQQGHKTPKTVRKQFLNEGALLTPEKLFTIVEEDQEEVAAPKTQKIEEGKASEFKKPIKKINEVIKQKFRDNKPVKSSLYKKTKFVRKLPNVPIDGPKRALPPIQGVESFKKVVKTVIKKLHVNDKVIPRTLTVTAAAKKEATKIKENEKIIRQMVECKQPKLDKNSILTWNRRKKESAFKENRKSFLSIHLEEENKTDKNIIAKFDKKKFYNEFLKRHNKYRAVHDVLPLKLNEKLMEIAALRAQYLAENNLTQIDVIDYGENVQLITGNIQISAKEIVKSWYQQINDYNFDESKPVTGKITEGFTQMIWKGSLELGFGIARAGEMTWVCALYDPPGNIADEFQKNVPPNEKAIFVKQCLAAHNKYRQLHGCPPLNLDTTLCNSANKWAKTTVKLKGLKEPECIPYGVNMFHGEYNRILTGDEVVEKWYNEGTKYNFDAGIFSKQTQHFAQIIWRDTRDLGIGYVRIGLHTFVVCYYDPAGNSAGEFLNNVYRIGGRPPQIKAVKKLTFEEEVLAAHNKYRSMHGCRPLVLNDELSANASYLAYLSFLETQNFPKCLLSKWLTKRKPNGVNQFHGKNVQHLSADYLVKTWYDEKYSTQTEFDEQTIAPFEQIVRASAKAIGIGTASSLASHEVWIVCCYDNPAKV